MELQTNFSLPWQTHFSEILAFGLAWQSFPVPIYGANLFCSKRENITLKKIYVKKCVCCHGGVPSPEPQGLHCWVPRGGGRKSGRNRTRTVFVHATVHVTQVKGKFFFKKKSLTSIRCTYILTKWPFCLKSSPTAQRKQTVAIYDAILESHLPGGDQSPRPPPP